MPFAIRSSNRKLCFSISSCPFEVPTGDNHTISVLRKRVSAALHVIAIPAFRPVRHKFSDGLLVFSAPRSIARTRACQGGRRWRNRSTTRCFKAVSPDCLCPFCG
jgi:hypothetical protein